MSSSPILPSERREHGHRAFFVQPLTAAGAWVDVEQRSIEIALDFEDVRVPTDEEVDRVEVEPLPHPRLVASRVAADVGHEHLHAADFEAVVTRKLSAQLGSVDVAEDAPHRFPERFELFQHLEGAEVPGVPDLVTLGSVVEDALVEIAVGV